MMKNFVLTEGTMSHSGFKLGIVALLAGWLLAAAAPAQAQAAQNGQWDTMIVQPGMTLTAIMRDRYAAYRPQWPQIIDLIVEANPHAFVNGAPASLKRGARIRVPRQVAAAPRRRPAAGSVQPSPDPTRQRAVPAAVPVPTPAPASTVVRPVTAPQAVRTPSVATPAPAPRALPAPLASEPATGAAELPPPMDEALAQSSPGAAPAEQAEERGSERPPWWWIISALLVVSFLF